MQIRAIALAALFAASFSAHADTVARWDFNNSTTKQAQSSGGDVSASLIGGTTATFVSGATTAATDKGWNTSTYAAQGAGDLTRGVQFMVSTVGYTNLLLTFDQRDSGTASAYTMLQYTTDGSNWINGSTYFMPAAKATTFVTGITYDFSAITAVNDNANFGVRLLASFAPGTSTYLGADGKSAYTTGGTIRYDNVTFSGTAIPDPLPVPEPQTYALMLAGLATVAWVARRRRAR